MDDGCRHVHRFLLLLICVLSVAQFVSCVTLETSSENGKVMVELYSESLCPYCKNFIVDHLSKFFLNGLIDMVDLRIIPFGNAHIYEGGSMVCQHGEDECRLNVIQSCAIDLWPSVFQWFPFIHCLEALDKEVAYEKWISCVAPSGLALEPLFDCYLGPRGVELQIAYAEETESLNPPKRYVPWVLVNGTPLQDDYMQVDKYVCEAYNGPLPKPDVCSALASFVSSDSIQAGVCGQEGSSF